MDRRGVSRARRPTLEISRGQKGALRIDQGLKVEVENAFRVDFQT
jgi:hypothetical protein